MNVACDPVRLRLRFMILTLLAVKPSHGYELSKTIEEITLGNVKASPGSLYPLAPRALRGGPNRGGGRDRVGQAQEGLQANR
ncbi:hypothetical protein JCM10135_11720 [Stetteria hydrogenophila]